MPDGTVQNDLVGTLSQSEASTVIMLSRGASGDGLYFRRGKRAFDIIVILLVLPVVFPLIAALMMLVAAQGGKAIFSHPRVGRDGRIFRCYKIRSMAVDAEARLVRHLAENPAAAQEWAECRKLRRDPRITKLGRVLRRSSLDELPQLWNVLRGDMSLVGPRPVTEDEMTLYGTSSTAYCSVRPGLTGLWQVSGRNEVSYASRVALDTTYVDSLSFARDLRILFRTLPAVLRVTGC